MRRITTSHYATLLNPPHFIGVKRHYVRMPTTLRTFPVQPRSGTQQTAYIDLPNKFDFLQLTSSASDATHSDEANGIRFEVLYSANGSGNDERIIQVEDWTGGTFIPKGGSTPIPRAVDVTFGPIPDTGAIALRAIFNRTITIGASVVGLP